ncbi:putative reverse transcriptase domain-containing protein [Tanacetum coccineum]
MPYLPRIYHRPEYSEEEEAETMAETMEQYMSKTRSNYGSRVARPKIEDKDNFELKGQFLKDGLKTKFLNKYYPPARTAKKMEEINNFQQEPDENLYQAWERFKELLMKCPQHDLTETQECMTRSSTSKLFTPYKEPEREFRSSRRHFKTLSLDELRSPDFNLFSDQEYSEEEEVETMAEPMEQYMSKTRADY